MLIIKRIEDLNQYLNKVKKQGKTIGFVPTMGALHPGHISLIAKSKKMCGLTVCSIFVNPTQFNDPADFEKYPATLEADLLKLKAAKCDVVFVPSVLEMYPNGFKNTTAVDYGFLADTLEGEFRPGHFNGMSQVVEKLLRAVKPHLLFMGQKDYQQQLIVGLLIKKRRLKVKLVTCPTLREKDGLAMSSRNVRLGKRARKLAVEISKTLKQTIKELRKMKLGIQEIQTLGAQALQGVKGIEMEYFQIRNALTLKHPKSKNEKLVVLTAVKIDGVRLIDNMIVG